MYRIYLVHYGTIKLRHNPLIIGSWITFEGEPEYITNDLEDAKKVLQDMYAKKFYKEEEEKWISCLLFYILDNDYNIIAALDFDGTILMNTDD